MDEAIAEVMITNRRGLHARAAAKVAGLAELLPVEVHVSFDGQSVSANSIMGLMLLGAGKGANITLSATGVEASASVARMVELIRAGFYEGE